MESGDFNKGRSAFKFEKSVVERRGFCGEISAMVEWVLFLGSPSFILA